MIKTKVRPPCATSFPVSPHQPNPHIPSPERDGHLVNPGDCCRPSRPGSRCGCLLGDRGGRDTGPAPAWAPPCSLLALPRDRCFAPSPSLHSHSHSPAQKPLCASRRPGPATLFFPSKRSPPEPALSPQMSPRLLAWRTSSPGLNSTCSWKDGPKCKTNAHFPGALGREGVRRRSNKAKNHRESKPERSVTGSAFQKGLFNLLSRNSHCEGMAVQVK